MNPYEWPSVGEFLGRQADLEILERWWVGSERMPLSLYGRRRCGKSWLLRRFAHGKPAVVLVAQRTAPGDQMQDLSVRLEPLLGVRPSLTGLPELIRVLYRAAYQERLLVVLDEFPYLLPTTEAETDRVLTAVAAVMEEERERSGLGLVLCGSLVSQMEALLAERGPLHGRLQPMQLQPVPFEQARLFMERLTPIEQMERFAVAGGMPRYLAALGDGKDLARTVTERVLDPNTALWDECRAVLDQELREPKVYFSLLRELGGGDKDSGELASAIRSDAPRTSKYLSVLEQMRLIERRLPAGSEPTSRGGHWHLRDPFFRFWFRFVFPFQSDLESGLPGSTLWKSEVAPVLNDHVAPEFEDFCRRWTRATQKVSRVDAWWGLALHSLRKNGTRTSEEIDIVGSARGKVTLVGEARWRNKPLTASYLDEIDEFKLPALRQSKLDVVAKPEILLFSKAGYAADLRRAADMRPDVRLLDVAEVLTSLS